MNTPTESESTDLPVFEPDAETTYAIELVAELTGMSTQTILHYQEHGLIAPVAAGAGGSLQFNTETLRTLRRIEHLRTSCETNLSGLRFMLTLLDEVERLRAALRSHR